MKSVLYIVTSTYYIECKCSFYKKYRSFKNVFRFYSHSIEWSYKTIEVPLEWKIAIFYILSYKGNN